MHIQPEAEVEAVLLAFKHVLTKNLRNRIQMDLFISNWNSSKNWPSHNRQMPKRVPKEPEKKAPIRKPADHWDLEARRVLKTEMLKANVDAEALAARIHAIGEDPSSETALALRISRGTFSFGFALQALKALGVTSLDISYIKSRRQG